ncbi:hypothetical protein K458DRAFT_382383 [Lentithecium fluviatile CBS 122367]|uniref:Heterokaryon incompatibility domain-containing protein n=1 Tax=Lentithecium fluviatile CBS 122367 TaxID=1168545 RepID=A0A6G1JK55_9PLEO|nr:hypothetical protein K458DRAFT_382383 [Lentithecium fluviatile CBS 122367]
MESLRNGERLRELLASGIEVNATWTLLQVAALLGTPDMVQDLLDHGARMDVLTRDNQSVVDLACEAQNWSTFHLLKRVADDRWQFARLRLPSFEYPSKFFLSLRNPFTEEMRKVSLKDFEDGLQLTRSLKASGELFRWVPYPYQNERLVQLWQETNQVASLLQREGKQVERALTYTKFWLFRCLKFHEKCHSVVPISKVLWPELPKRVVDVRQVQEGRVKLVDGFPRRSPYCALSYRWGQPCVTTTTESIEEFRNGISIDSLQTEIRDACFIANGLGIPFVWVDALRSQSDPGDWEDEAPKMVPVYGNATLTLAFTDHVRFGTTAAERPYWRQSREFGVLDTRGWALQESLLSRRVLFVTKNGLFWECLDDMGSMSESRCVGIPEPSDNFHAINNRKLKLTILHTQPSISEGSRETLMCLWRRVAEEYTARHLTYEEDRVMAVASIMTRLAGLLNDVCLLGISRRAPLRSLLWHARKPSPRPQRISYPSWSWYSVQGAIGYRTWTPFEAGASSQPLSPRAILRDDMRDPCAEVLDVFCDRDERNHNIYRGHVTISGRGLKAYFQAGNQREMFLPRRHGAEEELIEDLQRGTVKPVRHDAGPQSEYNYVVEFPFIDALDFPGTDGYREVVCVIVGHNDFDGFPLALILENVVGKQDTYQRVGAVAIDTRQIAYEDSTDYPWSDVMGETRTFIIV